MSAFSQFPLQQAIYQVLTADSTLMRLVTGVYDRPPQGTGYPYVTLGEAAGADWCSKTTSGMEYTLTLHAFSREGGRKEAATIMERIYTLLHDTNPAISGQAVVLLRFSASDITLANDGYTYDGQVRFRALLEATA